MLRGRVHFYKSIFYFHISLIGLRFCFTLFWCFYVCFDVFMCKKKTLVEVADMISDCYGVMRPNEAVHIELDYDTDRGRVCVSLKIGNQFRMYIVMFVYRPFWALLLVCVCVCVCVCVFDLSCLWWCEPVLSYTQISPLSFAPWLILTSGSAVPSAVAVMGSCDQPWQLG